MIDLDGYLWQIGQKLQGELALIFNSLSLYVLKPSSHILENRWRVILVQAVVIDQHVKRLPAFLFSLHSSPS